MILPSWAELQEERRKREVLASANKPKLAKRTRRAKFAIDWTFDGTRGAPTNSRTDAFRLMTFDDARHARFCGGCRGVMIEIGKITPIIAKRAGPFLRPFVGQLHFWIDA